MDDLGEIAISNERYYLVELPMSQIDLRERHLPEDPVNLPTGD